MALTLAVTPAGRAALRNAAGDGTNAVRIASVGVSATAFAPGDALPDEIKRLSTIVGGATAPDTIHVTINDAGTDVYAVQGFGFYLADGTLFASYGQAAVIVEKSAQSMMQLAVDVQFADIASADITFGDTNFNNPAATTERVGVVELATDAETTAGTDLQRVVTPKGLLAALNARLGAGAPSDFVKNLLTKATVLAFVTALGIRGAAQYDTGSGNGLDADLLDGKDGSFYLAWANLTGVPASFPTTAHTHSADDITSGILPVVRGGTGLGTLPAGAYLVGNGTGAVGAKTPAQVLVDIGAAAKAHSHAQSDIIGLVDALSAKAPLASPALSGVPTAPTAATTVNTAQIATTAYVQAVIANVINGAPGALDTLRELADAMGDDPNFAATVTNALAQKASLSGAAFTGQISTTANCIAVSFVSNGTDPVFATSTTGNLHFRPNGPASAVGQVLIASSGLVTASGFTATGTFITSGPFGGYQINDRATGNAASTWYSTGGATRLFAQGIGVDAIQMSNTTGAITLASSITAAGGFQNSDRRLKRDIKARAVQRGLALSLANMFTQWTRKADGVFDVGLIAQRVRKLASAYVKVGDDRKKLLAIDKAGLALEASMDNALDIAELRTELSAIQRLIRELEREK